VSSDAWWPDSRIFAFASLPDWTRFVHPTACAGMLRRTFRTPHLPVAACREFAACPDALPIDTRAPPGDQTPATTLLLSGLADIERDSLSQGQFRAIVDRAGLTAHVGLPTVGACLATTSRRLLATEGSPDLRP
jgi:hypothetical protein